MARVNGSRNRDDVVGYNLGNLDGVALDLGAGYDVVKLGFKGSGANRAVLAFTGADVGDGIGGQNGPAVEVQGTNPDVGLYGPVGRFDDEGISFLADTMYGFEIHDGLNGMDFGRLYQVARLGTSGNDLYDEAGSKLATYINGGLGNDHITGGIGNDQLVGGAGADRLSGDAGNDILIGGVGRDTIMGGDGDDIVIAKSLTDGADTVDLGIGRDSVLFYGSETEGSYIALRFDANEVGNGDAHRDGDLAIESYAQEFTGNQIGPLSRYDDEGIKFAAGDHSMIAVYDGNPDFNGTYVHAVEFGTNANDVIDYGEEFKNVAVYGGDGNDTLIGGQYSSFLFGGSGADRLVCVADTYIMTGGEGADTFAFSGQAEGAAILDFEDGIDKFDLSAFGITFAAVSIEDFGLFQGVSVDTNGDGGSDLYLVTENTVLVESDFVF